MEWVENMEKQFKLFLEFLEKDKKASDNTLQSYRRDIEQYQEYIQNNKINYAKISTEELNTYFEHYLIIVAYNR